MAITIKSKHEIKAMRKAGRIVGECLALMQDRIKPGVSTAALDEAAHDFIVSQGAKPSFKGYYGYPATVCSSLNEEVVHGIPSPHRILEEGDILTIDVGAIYEGYQGDAAVTYPVGVITVERQRLLEVTRQALYDGIARAVAGRHLSDISAAIQACGESHGYSVVRQYVGHGIGRAMHEEPQVPNFGPPGYGPVLKQGMALALEPMFNVGTWKVRVLDDHWTVVTEDGSLSAHFEHTILITEGEPEILTRHDAA